MNETKPFQLSNVEAVLPYLTAFTFEELRRLCRALGVSFADLGKKGETTRRTKESMMRGIRRKMVNNFPDRRLRFLNLATDIIEERGLYEQKH